ncbi:hypothetical protein [Paenibacillus sp. BAC0078]
MNIYVKILIYLGSSLLIAFFLTLILSYCLAYFLAGLSQFVDDSTTRFFAAYLIPFIFTIIFVLSFSLLTRHIVKKMILMKQALQVINEGDLSYRVPSLSFHELDKVAANINLLVDHLQQEIRKERKMEHPKKELIEDIVSGLHGPLNSLINDVTLLKSGAYNSQEEYANLIHDANTKAIYLKKVINELLHSVRLVRENLL